MGIEVALLAAGTALAAGSAIYSGIQQKQASDTQAELATRQAAQEKDAAVAQAEKIRKATRQQNAEATANLAASGISVGSGTPVRISNEIYKTGEQDAYQTILSGNRAYDSGIAQAGMLSSQGNNAMTAGVLNAGSSLLSGAAASYKAGWAKKAPTINATGSVS